MIEGDTIQGNKFLEEFPETGIIFTMNARCENMGCQGSKFRTNEDKNIVCVNCGTSQTISNDRGVHFWTTRVWKPLAS